MKVRIPALHGCCDMKLDMWEANEDGTLTYRFTVDLINNNQCRVTGETLLSKDIHDLTRERVAQPDSWYWLDVETSFDPIDPTWRQKLGH